MGEKSDKMGRLVEKLWVDPFAGVQPAPTPAVGLGIGNDFKLFLSKKSLLQFIPLAIVADSVGSQ